MEVPVVGYRRGYKQQAVAVLGITFYKVFKKTKRHERMKYITMGNIIFVGFIKLWFFGLKRVLSK